MMAPGSDQFAPPPVTNQRCSCGTDRGQYLSLIPNCLSRLPNPPVAHLVSLSSPSLPHQSLQRRQCLVCGGNKKPVLQRLLLPSMSVYDSLSLYLSAKLTPPAQAVVKRTCSVQTGLDTEFSSAVISVTLR